MLIKTWDGSNDAELHALPLEAKIPSISNPIRIGSPSKPLKQIFKIFEREFLVGVTIAYSYFIFLRLNLNSFPGNI